MAKRKNWRALVADGRAALISYEQCAEVNCAGLAMLSAQELQRVAYSLLNLARAARAEGNHGR